MDTQAPTKEPFNEPSKIEPNPVRRRIEAPNETHFTEPEAVARAYAAVGRPAVLLPVKRGTKLAAVAWGDLTYEGTQHLGHMGRFADSNVGVAVKLGKCSNNLCSIDCDSDESLAEFLSLNPWARYTLLTKGRRGGNVWVRITGNYPSTTHLPDGLGEWRADNHYTMLFGTHPAGMAYQIVHQYMPMEIAFTDIKWPAKIEAIWSKEGVGSSLSSFSSETLGTEILRAEKLETEILNTVHCATKPPTPVSCATESSTMAVADVLEEAKLHNKCIENYETWKADIGRTEIVNLYEQQVERYHVPARGERNKFIVESAPRLFFAVDSVVAKKLMMAFYDINQPLFKDSREKHEQEVDAALRNVEETFIKELPGAEAELYQSLADHLRSAFRIFRDLAKRELQESGSPQFFISERQLGTRLGRSHADARRILHRFFISIHVIESVPVENKKQREAATYRWRLPLPQTAK